MAHLKRLLFPLIWIASCALVSIGWFILSCNKPIRASAQSPAPGLTNTGCYSLATGGIACGTVSIGNLTVTGTFSGDGGIVTIPVLSKLCFGSGDGGSGNPLPACIVQETSGEWDFEQNNTPYFWLDQFGGFASQIVVDAPRFQNLSEESVLLSPPGIDAGPWIFASPGNQPGIWDGGSSVQVYGPIEMVGGYNGGVTSANVYVEPYPGFATDAVISILPNGTAPSGTNYTIAGDGVTFSQLNAPSGATTVGMGMNNQLYFYCSNTSECSSSGIIDANQLIVGAAGNETAMQHLRWARMLAFHAPGTLANNASANFSLSGLSTCVTTSPIGASCICGSGSPQVNGCPDAGTLGQLTGITAHDTCTCSVDNQVVTIDGGAPTQSNGIQCDASANGSASVEVTIQNFTGSAIGGANASWEVPVNVSCSTY